MRWAIPLHATEKQGFPAKARAKVELEVVAVSNMTDAEIVFLLFAMDDEIHPWGQKNKVFPKKAWAKVELEVVVVSNMTDAEIVVLRFAMDDEIRPWGQVVIDQYMRFVWQKTRPAHLQKRRQREQQDDRGRQKIHVCF
ncbi:hypothetical protein V6N13_061777 [Hibiscus sabdariffa]|uniref:Uncharacterized protein n=1 Tax=Hibiscus sabdariffa TaxID=183260 RepID=A0ABR2B297_9ROSI